MSDGLTALTELAQQYAGASISEPRALKGDGSDRQIFRFHAGAQSFVGVTNPHRQENEAFLYLSKAFHQLKIPVPRVYAEDLDHDCYLLEDLGDTPLSDQLDQWNQEQPANHQAIVKAYQQVIQWMPVIQLESHQHLDYSFCYDTRELDEAAHWRDLKYFQDYFWKLFASHTPLTDELNTELQQLAQLLGAILRNAFVSRDFQSRNVMWHHESPYFIDYQSGCIGTPHYDLAALLYASRAGLTPTLRAQLLEYYLDTMNQHMTLDRQQFLEEFYQFVLIRRLRSLGTYGFLPSQKGKLYFLDAIPNTLQEIAHLLNTIPALHRWSQLRGLFDQWSCSSELCSVAWLKANI